MQSMKDTAEEKDASAWAKLRTRLNVDRSAIDAVKAHSDFPRHAKLSSITDQQRIEVFLTTEAILRRFIEFLVNNRVALDSAAYPLLQPVSGTA
jgi:hypothetical protein